MEAKLKEQLLGAPKGLSALDLARALNVDKKEINRYLYGMERKNLVSKTNGTPPIWSAINRSQVSRDTTNAPKPAGKRPKQQGSKRPKQRTKEFLVYVDLGNVHDILQPLEQYADQVEVLGFADNAFNGYGVNPKSLFHVHQSSTGHKNEADTTLIWKLAQRCSIEGPLLVVICTRDNGFRNLKELVEASGPGRVCHFVTNWGDLEKILNKRGAPRN
eukprot:m.343747 g.343747  ORF g.343747 m.343747 type:complete len:217 (+) comp23241_c0_seq1:311-961(+)